MSKAIGSAIIRIDFTESTNNYATRQITDNEVQDGTVFLAQEQSAGRGQLDNRWESEPGKNLTLSIIVRPTFLNIRKQFLLSKVVCLGLEAFLSKYIEGVKIKWPNDIYVEDRKICGILIESSIMNWQISHSVIGIGLNINQKEFESDAPNPVSLSQITGEKYNLDELLDELMEKIDFYYKMLKSGKYSEIDMLFVSKLYRINEWFSYRDKSHQFVGMITGVNEIGKLKVHEKDGEVHEYHFKEVEYL